MLGSSALNSLICSRLFSSIVVRGSDSAGKLIPKSIFDVATASPTVFGAIVNGINSALKSALPSESTDATWRNCPAEFTTVFCSSSRNEPFRVKRSCPSAEDSGKKPSPVTAKSSEFPDNSMLPCENSWVTCFNAVP